VIAAAINAVILTTSVVAIVIILATFRYQSGDRGLPRRGFDISGTLLRPGCGYRRALVMEEATYGSG
jgi:hypothetical protein